jgi:single-strand DNA-binding protein
MSFLKVTMIGNIGKIELKYLPSGVAITNMNVASNRTYTKDDQKVKETTWVRVSVFGKQAEACAKYLEVGSQVFVEGRLNPDDDGGPRLWESNGKQGASYEVTAERVVFLSGAVQTAQEEQF